MSGAEDASGVDERDDFVEDVFDLLTGLPVSESESLAVAVCSFESSVRLLLPELCAAVDFLNRAASRCRVYM